MFALDGQHRITWCNGAAEELYGFSAGEVRGVAFGQATNCDWPPVGRSSESEQRYDGWSGQLRQQTHAGPGTLVDVSMVAQHQSGKVDRYIILARRAGAGLDELANALEERERFDALLSELSTQFSGLLEEEVDGAIESGLKKLVSFLGASRSTFTQVTPSGALVITHTYAVRGVVDPAPKGIVDDRFPWLVGEMRAGRAVILTTIKDLPPEAHDVRRMMELSGMKAGIAIPLHVGNSLVCVLTVGEFARERHWPLDLISRLRVAGEIFANAIARKQAKEQLQARQQELTHLARVVALSELASVIAHELDQPLTAIITNAQAGQHLLKQDVPDIAESREALGDIIADAMRASQIVRRERRLLRKAKPNVEALDLNEVIREIELFIRADAREHGSHVEASVSAKLPQVLADRVQLQQVVLNVTRNGIQAMTSQPREKRALRISATAVGQEVVVGVQDAGPPIDDARLAQMFEPFFTTKGDGLGMGLSISRSIVQAHNGRMWASRNQGQSGLTVHIAIPLAQGGAACLTHTTGPS